MKKIRAFLMSLILVFILGACRGESVAADIIISSYDDMQTTQILNFTSFDDGEMLGDAYYVTGTVGETIESVNYYKDEYIYFSLSLSENQDSGGIIIEEVTIEYCDYKKEIFLSTTAYDFLDPYTNHSVTYDELFGSIEQMSIQEMRYILTALDLL